MLPYFKRTMAHIIYLIKFISCSERSPYVDLTIVNVFSAGQRCSTYIRTALVSYVVSKLNQTCTLFRRIKRAATIMVFKHMSKFNFGLQDKPDKKIDRYNRKK